MSVAAKMQDYLTARGVAYDTIMHPHTANTSESAHLAHVPEDRLVKAVVLEDDAGYLLALVPGDRRVRLGILCKQLQRPGLRLATESELGTLFTDCSIGAVPPVGEPYGIATVMERSLAAKPELYLEAGDHEHLLRLGHDDFMRLMSGVKCLSCVKGAPDIVSGARLADDDSL